MQDTFLAKLPHTNLNKYFQPVVCGSWLVPIPEKQLLSTLEFYQRVGTLKLAQVEVFTPRKLTHVINQGFILGRRGRQLTSTPLLLAQPNLSFEPRQ